MQLKTDSACALRNSHPTQAKCWAWGVEEQTCCGTREDLSSQEPGHTHTSVQGHVLARPQERPWFKRRGRRMTHVTAGLQIRQEGNVQCLSSELAVLPSLKHFHCLNPHQTEQLVWLEASGQPAQANSSSSACEGLDCQRERE